MRQVPGHLLVEFGSKISHHVAGWLDGRTLSSCAKGLDVISNAKEVIIVLSSFSAERLVDNGLPAVGAAFVE